MIYPYETCVSLVFLPYKTPRKQGKRKAKFHFLLYHAKVLLFLLKYHWFLCKLHNKKRPWPAEITPQKANLCKIKVFILYCLIWQHFITLLGHTMHDQLMHCHRILPREASAGSRQNSSENHPMYTQDSHFPGYGFCPKTGYMALPCDIVYLTLIALL